MTVAELIARLQQFPPDMQVVVGGFDEWGFDDPGTFEVVELKPVEKKPHSPAYESSEDVDGSEDGPAYKRKVSTGPAFRALCVDR